MKLSKRIVGIGVVVLVAALGMALLAVRPVGSVIYVPLDIASRLLSGAGRCEVASFYVDEQVIYDDTLLEGDITQIQDKRSGLKEHCRTYTKGTVTTVTHQPTPSIVRVGTKKFKDEQLLALAPSAGIIHPLGGEDVSIYYVDNYTDFVWATGAYSDYKKAITVKRSSDQQKVILAHEYLHYVWYRDKLGDNPLLVSELISFYDRSPDLQERMSPYAVDMTKPTEFFSYGCTEWSDYQIGLVIKEYCEKYINRTMLLAYR